MISMTAPSGKYRVISWCLKTRAVANRGDFADREEAIRVARELYRGGASDASVFNDIGKAIFAGHADGPPIDFARLGSAVTGAVRGAYKRR